MIFCLTSAFTLTYLTENSLTLLCLSSDKFHSDLALFLVPKQQMKSLYMCIQMHCVFTLQRLDYITNIYKSQTEALLLELKLHCVALFTDRKSQWRGTNQMTFLKIPHSEVVKVQR